ncbi:DNA topoisomerase (ATP-hydrolyzing) subunit A [Citricoccus sp.]|uniref:DNA gyrase/topoisomerase IV subunit A n=1 Tax=Citricoccus sp. TaxID=1978372 RepID=UPI0026066CB7|nr:DNA topoisomerase (ATP-hydrolyzing) [Citricoccus sp.]HRO30226.1 DNA topoisomerase 4 subunit A [Citricoccus sp.]HRO94913.1 DNA topoisomerase 4 subunit A [Citricoccus sp.]
MARTPKKTSAPASEAIPLEQENIVDIDVSAEMETSFLEYAYSVIYSRALPDARDGMKPVQRRILYMMSQMGLRPDRGHVKSARVVGEVMGKLHPHGDSAIYDAMVRLAQPFSLRLPLVDGHGNFGSLDDGPAAPRYTEARMAPAALAMTASLDEDVVDFVPNYDNQFLQPAVLPAAFPNLLVNGASGIAVGMATNMAPHNLREVVAAAQHLIAHPEATLEELMRHVPGPDLPSGGRIVGLDGIRDAYASGRGSFKMRAKVSVEQVTPRKTGLVVTELPYGVGPEKVIEKIKDAVNAKKLTGISDVLDLTDRRNGLKLVIELKSGFNPQGVLAQLYKATPMEESFGINNVALVEGQPRTLGLRELLQVYVEHRLDVVRRRTAHRLGKKKDRLHLVEGLLLALVDIDEVIQIIRSSDDTAAARTRLMGVFDLTEIQANHILELRLRQLTKYSRIELEAEQDELRAAIEELEAILASDERLRALVSAELQDVADEFGDDRRTVLLESENIAAPSPTAGAVRAGTAQAALPGTPGSDPLMVADTPCLVVLTTAGQLARTVDDTPLVPGGRRQRHDAYRSVVATSARGEIGALTSSGRIQRVQVVDIPSLPDASPTPNLTAGVKVKDFLTLQRGESLVALVPLDTVLALGTSQGVVKRVNPDWPLNRDDFEAITLKDGDEVVGAGPAPGDDDQLVFITRTGQLLRYAASLVRPQGRTAGGMAGIKVAAGDAVIAFSAVPAAAAADDAAEPGRAVVVTVTKGEQTLPGTVAGSVKRTPLAEYPAKGRATGGVRAHRLLKGEMELALAWAGAGPAVAATATGVARALPAEYGSRDGSGLAMDQVIEAVGAGASPERAGTAAGTEPVATGAGRPAVQPREDALPFADDSGVTTGD